MKTLVTTLGFSLLASASAWANCDPGETVVRFGALATNEVAQRQNAITQFKTALDKEMQGKFCVQILRDDAQFAGVNFLTALSEDRIEMTAPAFSDLAKRFANYRIFGLPFAFRNDRTIDAFLTVSKTTLQQQFTQSGLTGLGHWHGSFDQLSAKRPVYNPTDIGGMKIRFGEEGDRSFLLDVLKATEVKVPENDLSIALKTGRVDAQVSSWKQMNDDKTANLLSGITQTNHRYDGFQLVVATSWWSKLDPKQSKSLQEAIERINRQINFETQRQNTNAKRAIMRSGVPIRVLTQKQREKWRMITQPLWDDFSNSKLKAAVKQSNLGL